MVYYCNKSLKTDVQGLPYWFVILLRPRFSTRTVIWVKNGPCICSLGLAIGLLTFRMNFESRDWHPQPPTFSSNSTKITKKWTISNSSFDTN